MYAIPIVLLALIVWPIVSRWWNDFQERKQRAAELACIRLIQSPRLIYSAHEADNTVQERADDLKRLIVLSGNTWITADDVVVRIYHPHATSGHVCMTFEVWESLVREEFNKIRQQYAAKMAGSGEQYHAPMCGQKINLNTR